MQSVRRTAVHTALGQGVIEFHPDGLDRFIESEKKNIVRELYPDIGGSSLDLLPIGNIASIGCQTLRS
jgi:hypothetical protein